MYYKHVLEPRQHISLAFQIARRSGSEINLDSHCDTDLYYWEEFPCYVLHCGIGTFVKKRTPGTTGPTSSVAMSNDPSIPARDTITREFLETQEQVSPENSPHIYKINDEILIKRVNGTRTTEAATMKYVRANTSIPVPQIYDVFSRNEGHDSLVYTVMECVEGELFDEAWVNAGEEV